MQTSRDRSREILQPDHLEPKKTNEQEEGMPVTLERRDHRQHNQMTEAS